MGVEIPALHPIIPWMIEYAALLINRFEVGKDGKTNFERCKGKKAKTLGIEFGEAVLWKRKPTGGALGKLTCMWEDGVYLGVKGGSGELIVADAKGVWKARTIQRKPVDERWAKSSIDMVVEVPWRTSDDDPHVDGEKMEAVRLSKAEVEIEKEVFQDAIQRRFFIEKSD